MTGPRLFAFALPTALALTCSTAALAAPFDGNWRMVVVTTSGHCGKIGVGMGISHGRIYATGGKFAMHRIQLAGRVSASGHAQINAVAGPRKAQGIGRFVRSKASGKWAGTGPSGVCSGIWSAVRL